MQTNQIPLALLGIEKGEYIKQVGQDIYYNSSSQVSDAIHHIEAGPRTMSDVESTSGIFANTDDEYRAADDN